MYTIPDGMHDPLKVNVKKLEREIKNELKIMHIDRPDVAAEDLEFL